jgi:magnesium chelatase subunit D
MLASVAPVALGGVRLQGAASPARQAWIDAFQAALPEHAAWQRLPSHAQVDALDAALDVQASLAQGQRVQAAGLLARAAGGVVAVAMAERLAPEVAARLGHGLDHRAYAVVALDESRRGAAGTDDPDGTDPSPPAALLDRLGLWVTLDERASGYPADGSMASSCATAMRLSIQLARQRWRQVVVTEAWVETLVQAAAALGVTSARACCHAVTLARIAAALDARDTVHEGDVRCAIEHVLLPRATQWPQPQAEPDSAEQTPSPDDPADAATGAPDAPSPSEPSAQPPAPSTTQQPLPPTDATPSPSSAPIDGPLPDRLIQAVLAQLPADILLRLAASIQAAPLRTSRTPSKGSASNGQKRVGSRGRLLASVRGDPRRGARLALIDTLRAAVPWQRLRRQQVAAQTASDAAPAAFAAAASSVLVRRQDLHVQRRLQAQGSVTIFAIDASGSQAMHRLAEAKGAVELLLARSYARRDRVAVIAFRGAGAQSLLAPTRSLVRAKRALAGLPGGGGTPLATGLDAAAQLAHHVQRGGAQALVVLLTDGRANVKRDGSPGRDAAFQEALTAARAMAAQGTRMVVVDTAAAHLGSGATPSPAQILAAAGRARCVALPRLDAKALSDVVSTVGSTTVSAGRSW